MSAFVVSHDHIDALLSFAKDKRIGDQLGHHAKCASVDWNTLGRVLLAENERSVCHRYPDVVPGNTPGVIGQEAINYNFRYFEPFLNMPHGKKCVWVVKACQCFHYQACETDDYEQSIAHRMIECIRSAATHSMPGYDDAPWEIHRPVVVPIKKPDPKKLGRFKH